MLLSKLPRQKFSGIILGLCFLSFGLSLLIFGCGQQGTATTTTTSTTMPWTGHVVLAEIFTAEGCPSCPLAVLVMERLAKDHGPLKLVIAEYHLNDGYSTAETNSRCIDFYGISGIPTVIFDGVITKTGAGQDYTPAIDERLSTQNTISLEAQANLANQKVTISGNISNESSLELSNLAVNFLILRDYEAAEHHYVVRDIMSQNITTLSAGASMTFIATSETLSQTDNLSAVVFVQKSDKEVLQALYKSL